MKYKCPKCKRVVKRDGRRTKGRPVRSFCDEYGATVMLRRVK